jgi:cytoskeletal protein RodZ
MTIEGLGKKFQEARLARGLTLDEAARMTKIRPSRLAEIEAEDFSQFPSLAYAKGFLQIYGKFLDVDVTPYLEAFETSGDVTVNGYSYLQENPPVAPGGAPVARRRPARASSSPPASASRPSIAPLLIGIVVIVVGFWIGKLVVNLRRLAGPEPAKAVAAPSASVAPTAPQFVGVPVASPAQSAAAPAAKVVVNTPAPALTPAIAPAATAIAAASPSATKQPEIRRAEPVRAEDLQKAAAGAAASSTTESAAANRVDIRPLKKTYLKVVVDNETGQPAFERWVSPSDGTVEFRGQHIAVRVLDRDAIQIKKNGKVLTEEDEDVTVE